MIADTTFIDSIEWLKDHSIFLKYQDPIAAFGGQSRQWQNPYGKSRPEDFVERSSVWFAAYPNALIGPEGSKVLDILGSDKLHHLLSAIGIEAIHTGPMKRSGSVGDRGYGPSIDGNFDRIELQIDPNYGSEEQYQQLVKSAGEYGITIIGDLVPGHTGKGPDFRLAERNVPGFPSLYTMMEIDPEDWSLLPKVPPNADSVNLLPDVLEELRERGYHLIGMLDAEIFARPGIKDSSWSATDVVVGVDGQERRWVYLHVFKQGQPSLNWTDPSFAAHRLLTADMLHSLHGLGAKGLRLDATMFLGIEGRAEDELGWLAGHPLSNQITTILGMMIRKFGGFSFQELNIDLDKIKESLPFGPELNYDFTTRPAYLYGLVTGDGGPLRLMLRQLLEHEVPLMRMVHGLQNHDELMLETTHLQVNGDRIFEYEGRNERGADLFERMHTRVVEKTTGDRAPYNKPFAMPGVCSTLAGLIAATLGVQDIQQISRQEIATIKRIHLLAAAYNALQPGVFIISGWDLVGALPLPEKIIPSLLADGDYRWINRGAYDLIGSAPYRAQSVQNMPRAPYIYGNLPEQLQDPNSFASRLQQLLELRKDLRIARSELVLVPEVTDPAVVILVNKLPNPRDKLQSWQVTALNFSQFETEQELEYTNLSGTARVLWSNLHGRYEEDITSSGDRPPIIKLLPWEAKLIVVSPPGSFEPNS